MIGVALVLAAACAGPDAPATGAGEQGTPPVGPLETSSPSGDPVGPATAAPPADPSPDASTAVRPWSNPGWLVGGRTLPDAQPAPLVGGWVPAVLDASLADVQFDLVTWDGSRFITVGQGVYATSVDGATWTRVDGDIDPSPFSTPDLPALAVDSAHAGSRWVAVGTQDYDGPCASYCAPIRGLVWTSRDGTTWTRAPRQASLDGAALNTVARIGGRWVAAGSKGWHAAAWSSTDGRTWTRVGKAAFRSDERVGMGDVHELVRFAGVLVAGGMDHGGETSVARTWWSADGLAWHEARMERARDGQVFTVKDAGPELLAIGPSSGCTGGVWATADGRSWVCAGADAAMRGFGPYDAAANGRVEVLVGLTSRGWDEEGDGGMPGAIWWRAVP